MLKTLKTILTLALLCSVRIKAELIKTDLFDFANLTSIANNVDILISNDIDPYEFTFFYNDEQRNSISLGLFKKMLEVKGLYLFESNGFYYVDAKPEASEGVPGNEELRYIRLKSNVKDEVSFLLQMYDKNATYIKSDNAVSFLANDKIYNEVVKYLELFDRPLDQVKFKLVISETNLKDIKDKGTDIKSIFGISRPDFKFYINLITNPYSNDTNILSERSDNYYGILSFLENNGITKIVSSPFLTAKNHTEVYFSSVENIPYLVQNSQTSSTQTTTQNSYEYKDVGLKIWITPVIIGDQVDFDLHLIIEDILSSNSLTPTTSKKELKSSYTLRRGDTLVLSGINKSTSVSRRNGIPVLKDIFLLKYLFSIEQEQELSSVVTLSIQAL
nr:MAG TPA: Type II secretion system protein [Inoviridae sp.]